MVRLSAVVLERQIDRDGVKFRQLIQKNYPIFPKLKLGNKQIRMI